MPAGKSAQARDRIPQVEILDTFAGEPVLVREGAITCATYHPELTSDRELHRTVFGVEGVEAG